VALTAIETPTVRTQASDLLSEARCELESTGWKPEEGNGGTIWRNPNEVHWYDELQALAIFKEGLDPGG
jgi:hypothetical protein